MAHHQRLHLHRTCNTTARGHGCTPRFGVECCRRPPTAAARQSTTMSSRSTKRCPALAVGIGQVELPRRCFLQAPAKPTRRQNFRSAGAAAGKHPPTTTALPATTVDWRVEPPRPGPPPAVTIRPTTGRQNPTVAVRTTPASRQRPRLDAERAPPPSTSTARRAAATRRRTTTTGRRLATRSTTSGPMTTARPHLRPPSERDPATTLSAPAEVT